MQRLQEHELVLLSVPEDRLLGTGDLRFHVIAMFESTATLHPVDPFVLERMPECVPGAYVSFRHAGHLVALHGALRVRDGTVRFNVSDGVSLPRRSSTRVELVAPVTVRRHDGSSETGVTVDMAIGGALIELDRPLEVDEEILLSIALTTREEPIETAARVVRTIDRQAGVSFTSIDRDARQFLSFQIHERSLADLQSKLGAKQNEDDLF